MHSRAISALLLVVALIHLLPISGAFGIEQLSSLYGVSIEDDNLAILMRHRAVLFGILGVFFVYAAVKPSVQPIAFAAAAVSIVSFFYFAFTTDDFNDAIKRVVVADTVAAAALIGAIVLYLTKPPA